MQNQTALQNTRINEKRENEMAANWAEAKKNTAAFHTLIGKALMGDRVATYTLCEKIAEGVLYRVSYFVKDEVDAENAALNTLLNVCRNIRTLREPKAFHAWLGGILLGEIRKTVSKTTRHGNIVSIDEYMSVQHKEKTARHPDEYVGEQSIRDAVMESVSQLPQRQREATILHYYDELSVGEIASAMNVSHNSVLKYLSQAKKRLSAELEERCHSGSVNAMALLPIGSILSDSLHAGTAEFYPSNVVWFERMMSQCQRQILAVPVAVPAYAATKSKQKTTHRKIPFGLAIGTCSTLIIAGALALGILLGGTSRQAANDSKAAQQAAIEAKIVFTGGVAHMGTERVNPIQAELLSGNSNSSLNVIQWWITHSGRGSDVILYEDRGGNLNIEEALNMLKENGQYGEYNLYLRFSDDHGYIYRLSSNFFISDAEVPLAPNP